MLHFHSRIDTSLTKLGLKVCCTINIVALVWRKVFLTNKVALGIDTVHAAIEDVEIVITKIRVHLSRVDELHLESLNASYCFMLEIKIICGLAD